MEFFYFLVAAYSLASKEDRKLWERDFNTYYIQPVLEDLDNKIEGAMDLITNDDTQGRLASYVAVHLLY